MIQKWGQGEKREREQKEKKDIEDKSNKENTWQERESERCGQ